MFTFNGFEFDEKSAKLTNTIDGESTHLRQKLVALLVYLLQHQSRIVTKQELLDELWDNGQFREKSLSQSILELRKSLGDSANSPKYIRTIPNQGYQWICHEETVSKNKTFLTKFRSLFKLKKVEILIILMVLTIALFWGYEKASKYNNSIANIETDKPLSVLILPFINQSGTDTMNWVQFGLSEMLAYDLAQFKNLKVTAPTQLTNSTLNHLLSNESINKLITENNADIAIRSVFSLQEGKQIISYQLINSQGVDKSKLLKRSDLAVSMPDVASKIYRELRPTAQVIELPEYDFIPSAMHDFARGLQALQNSGYILAQHYFKASVQIDKNHYWSELYLGISQVQVGHWLQAQETFRHIENNASEAGLLATLHYWQALLSYRKGLFVLSSEYLTSSSKYLVASPQNILSSQVIQLKSKLSQIKNTKAFFKTTSQKFIDHPEFLFETPLFNEVNPFTFETLDNTDKVIQQLTIKGYKPQLLRLLIAQSLSKILPSNQRNIAISRAVEIARQLEQPYDLAVALTVQGRIAIAQDTSVSRQYLIEAQKITVDLGAVSLKKEIDFYLVMSNVTEERRVGTKSSISIAKQRLEKIKTEDLNGHQQALFKEMQKRTSDAFEHLKINENAKHTHNH
jgi:DNA-binding winged helix-turn-helix (wHTH) protein/TolB-like protein